MRGGGSCHRQSPALCASAGRRPAMVVDSASRGTILASPPCGINRRSAPGALSPRRGGPRRWQRGHACGFRAQARDQAPFAGLSSAWNEVCGGSDLVGLSWEARASRASVLVCSCACVGACGCVLAGCVRAPQVKYQSSATQGRDAVDVVRTLSGSCSVPVWRCCSSLPGMRSSKLRG